VPPPRFTSVYPDNATDLSDYSVGRMCGWQAAAAGQNGMQASVIDLEASDEAVEYSSSSSAEYSSSRPSSHVEPVSAVIGKHLQKATTAPPTIRHFFKPKQLDNGETAKPVEFERERTHSDGCLDEEDDTVVMTSSDCEQLSNKPETDVVGSSLTSCSTATGSKSASKRLSSNKLPAAKKHKQSSIEALFSFAARNPQKQPGAMQCPICGLVFEETVSNADVNQHIDSCLIE